MLPLLAHDLKVMSVGFLIDAEQPMVWRGPMVTQALVQLLETTRWGELDYLIIDMPGISAVSPPMSAAPACTQPSTMPLMTDAATSTLSLPVA